MQYDGNLVAGKIVNVFDEMIVDVELTDGQIVSAFCGAVEIAEMCKPGMLVLLLQRDNFKRIIKYNLLLVKTVEGWVFAEPKYNRSLFKEAFVGKKMIDFANYKTCRALSQNDADGIDFELSTVDGQKAFVFVTSIYHKKNGHAVFPQKMNFFEIKMLDAMRKKLQEGSACYILLIAPREDCLTAQFAWNIDTSAAAAMFEAKQAGINFVCYSCKIEENNISLDRKMDIIF